MTVLLLMGAIAGHVLLVALDCDMWAFLWTLLFGAAIGHHETPKCDCAADAQGEE